MSNFLTNKIETLAKNLENQINALVKLVLL